jgi:hypothetical protein
MRGLCNIASRGSGIVFAPRHGTGDKVAVCVFSFYVPTEVAYFACFKREVHRCSDRSINVGLMFESYYIPARNDEYKVPFAPAYNGVFSVPVLLGDVCASASTAMGQ